MEMDERETERSMIPGEGERTWHKMQLSSTEREHMPETGRLIGLKIPRTTQLLTLRRQGKEEELAAARGTKKRDVFG